MNKLCKIFIKYLFIFWFCGFIYYSMEMLARGRSAFEMIILAGLCGVLTLASFNNMTSYDTDFIFQSVTCGTICTFLEWLCGVFFNSDHHIWNYTNLPLSTPDGQINFFFWILWCFLSAFSIPILDYIEYHYFNYKPNTPPYYKVFGKIIYRMKPKGANND